MEMTRRELHGKSPHSSPTGSGHLLLHKLGKSLELASASLKTNQSRL